MTSLSQQHSYQCNSRRWGRQVHTAEANQESRWVGSGLKIGKRVVSLYLSSSSSKAQLGQTFLSLRGLLSAQGKLQTLSNLYSLSEGIIYLRKLIYEMIVCKGMVFLLILTTAKCFTTAPTDDRSMRPALQVKSRLQWFFIDCSGLFCQLPFSHLIPEHQHCQSYLSLLLR